MARESQTVFVSYAGPDRDWAKWVAWQLREHGHQVELDVWDWQAGDSFVRRMSEAMDRAETMVALFSNAYFSSGRWAREEWTSRLGSRARLVPVVVEPLTAAVPGILADRIRVDLHGLDEAAALRTLLEAVEGRTADIDKPAFPAAASPEVHSTGAPRFPGAAAGSGRPEPSSRPDRSVVWEVPIGRTPYFTGREDVLTRIREGLRAGRLAVHGLGGIGKTQIALEYAHRFAGEYDLVWWIDAESADQLPVHYTELADRLGLSKPEVGTEHNTRVLLEHLRTRDRWLIVLDNAEDPKDFTGLLPTGPGHVLITTRNPGWSQVVAGQSLDAFTRGESLAYLSARLPGIVPEQADALADDLGDLPLALAQAAGTLAGGTSLERYRQLLAASTEDLLERGAPTDYPTSLAATVAIATSRLRADRPGAEALLRLGAFLGPGPIPTAWLESTTARLTTLVPDDILWPQDDLQALARYGLARLGYETFEIHRLTQAIVRAHTSEADATATTADVTALLAAADPGDPTDPGTWPRWAALSPHLIALQATATDHAELRRTLIHAAHYLHDSGQNRAARDLTAGLHESWTRVHGPDHPDALACAQYLSYAVGALGDYAEARRITEDTLRRRRRALGDDHPHTLESAEALTGVLASLGDYAEDRRITEDTLQRRRRTLGDNHPHTLKSAHGLAVTLGNLGNYAEARRIHEDTLQRRRHTLGDNHPDTLQSAHSLGGALADMGDYAEARRIIEDTLQRRRHTLGDNPPDTLQSPDSLAVSLNNLGVYAEARRITEDTLQRRRRTLGDNPPDTLQSPDSLAVSLNNLGVYAEARRITEDTLQRRRHTLGDNHPDTLQSAHSLGVSLGNLGDYAEARRIIEDTLQRRRHTLGDNHPDTLQSADSLGVSLNNLGDYAEARRIIEDTLQRRRHTLGDNHPDTLQSADSLGVSLNNLGDYAEARRIHEDTVQRRRRILGDDHPDTLESTHSLGITLANLRAYAAAERLVSEARRRSLHTLGPKHPLSQKLTDLLADLLTHRGMGYKAQQLRTAGKPRPRRTKRKPKG